MGFFKKVFGGEKEQETKTRSLKHPGELQKGDILKFGFTGQKILSNRSWTVEGIDTLDLGGERHKKGLLTIESEGERVRLSPIGRDRVEVGINLLPDDVQQLFDMDAFINLLDPDSGVHHVLERIGEPDTFSGWTAPVYRQEAGNNAYLFRDDYRERLLPEDADEGEEFSHYLLVSDDRNHSLEVQVFEGGHTVVTLIVNISAASIEELWPAASHA